jgi:hypothetical protein
MEIVDEWSLNFFKDGGNIIYSSLFIEKCVSSQVNILNTLKKGCCNIYYKTRFVSWLIVFNQKLIKSCTK